MNQFTTPARSVRGLGSAGEGVKHFIHQRASAIALVVLVPWFLFSVMFAMEQGYEGALSWAGKPWNAILLLLTFGAAAYHSRLGMQTVAEDYMRGHFWRYTLLTLNAFGSIAILAVAAFAILKIWLGA